MFCRTFDEGELFQCAGNQYAMLLPRDITECTEVVLEKVAPGQRTPPNAHATFVQIYIIMQGEAEVTVGNDTRRVAAPAVAFIPRNTNHYVVNSGTVELRYLYVTVWPDGIPRAEFEGGWKKVYADMIQEYADRGYPAKRLSS